MTTKVTVEKESDSEMQDINQQRVITEVQVKLLSRFTNIHTILISDQKSGTRFSRPSRGQIQVWWPIRDDFGFARLSSGTNAWSSAQSQRCTIQKCSTLQQKTRKFRCRTISKSLTICKVFKLAQLRTIYYWFTRSWNFRINSPFLILIWKSSRPSNSSSRLQIKIIEICICWVNSPYLLIQKW